MSASTIGEAGDRYALVCIVVFVKKVSVFVAKFSMT